MSKLAPLAIVKKDFGSKEKLASQLAATMDIPEGQTREQFAAFLTTLPNAKLLRLHRVEQAFQSRFGGKTEKAVSAVIEKQGLLGKAADAFKERAARMTRARLLDMAGPAPKTKA